MKIAFFLDHFPSLTQTFVLNQIVGTIDAGHQVDIYAMSRGKPDKVDKRVFEYGLHNKTKYIPRAPKGYFARFAQFARLLFKHGWSHPGPILQSMNGLRFGRKAISLKLFFKIIPFLENGRQYDIIHCQFGMLGLEALAILKTGAIKGKLVTAFRGYDTERFHRKNPGAYDQLFKEGDLFLPVCTSFADWLLDKGCNPSKVKVLYSGIEFDLFEYKPRKRGPGEPVRLLTIARLVPKKGVEYAIKAVAGLIANGYNVNYTIVGDGPLKAQLLELARAKGIMSCVTLAGWQNRKEVMKHMEHSHILLAPSVSAPDGDREGIPNAIKEAMAMGMPVVSTYHSGIPELVEDGACGFLAEEGNPADLQKCIVKLINNEHLWEEYGKRGREKIEKSFDIVKLNRQLMECYRQLVDRIPAAENHVQRKAKAA